MRGHGLWTLWIPCAVLIAAGCGSVGDDDEPDGGDSMEPQLPAFDGDECITAGDPGDHAFTCDGIDFLVMIPDSCPDDGCGLIFDVHGATMSGAQMRLNTELDQLAPPQGFITVHPSQPGGSWNDTHYPTVHDFMLRTIDLLPVDEERVHITGFSQGGIMTWWFVRNHSDLLASAAPVAAVPSGIDDAGLDPEIPLLYMQGLTDTAFAYDEAEVMRDRLIDILGMKDEQMIAGDDSYGHTRWTNDNGTDFEFIWHDYGGQAVLAGHCIPGGTDTEGIPPFGALNATTCTSGDINFHWGELAMEWFVAHPRVQ